MILIRTDMALEAREMKGTGVLEGVEASEERTNNITVTWVKILDERGEKALGKPTGNYITIESPGLADRDGGAAKETARIMSLELRKLIGDKKGTTLVVGLGNWNMTPDALGPKVVERIFVTRHIKEYASKHFDSRMGVVAAISPGVLGITGIETIELIKGAAERLKPDRVICIDSLASRRSQRITASIQMTDSGISPGAGVGNRRSALDKESLGVDVIAIGVPMVVDASTLVFDAVSMMTEGLGSVSEQDIEKIMNKVLYEKFGGMVVTPKEIDMLVNDAAELVAEGINLALHDLPAEEIDEYLY